MATSLDSARIGFIGSGKMAQAMCKGFLASSKLLIIIIIIIITRNISNMLRRHQALMSYWLVCVDDWTCNLKPTKNTFTQFRSLTSNNKQLVIS